MSGNWEVCGKELVLIYFKKPPQKSTCRTEEEKNKSWLQPFLSEMEIKATERTQLYILVLQNMKSNMVKCHTFSRKMF